MLLFHKSPSDTSTKKNSLFNLFRASKIARVNFLLTSLDVCLNEPRCFPNEPWQALLRSGDIFWPL